MSTYEEDKKSLKNIIRRIGAFNFKKGEYLKEHFIIDDDTATIRYMGDDSILTSLLANAKVFTDSSEK